MKTNMSTNNSNPAQAVITDIYLNCTVRVIGHFGFPVYQLIHTTDLYETLYGDIVTFIDKDKAYLLHRPLTDFYLSEITICRFDFILKPGSIVV